MELEAELALGKDLPDNKEVFYYLECFHLRVATFYIRRTLYTLRTVILCSVYFRILLKEEQMQSAKGGRGKSTKCNNTHEC